MIVYFYYNISFFIILKYKIKYILFYILKYILFLYFFNFNFLQFLFHAPFPDPYELLLKYWM